MGQPSHMTSVLLVAVVLGAISATLSQPVEVVGAPIPAPANVCRDAAPDCNDICDQHTGQLAACALQTPIGDYLRYSRCCCRLIVSLAALCRLLTSMCFAGQTANLPAVSAAPLWMHLCLDLQLQKHLRLKQAPSPTMPALMWYLHSPALAVLSR